MKKRTPEEQRFYDAAYHFAGGFWAYSGRVVFWLVICALLLKWAGEVVLPTDDTDSGRFARSGVELITDAKTGRQYLVTSNAGGIVLREGAK